MKSLRQRGKPKGIPNSPLKIPEPHIPALELPYDILLSVFHHLSQLEEIEDFMARCAGDLANSYIELPISPLSRHFLSRARTDMRTCASVSHAWREAALSVFEDVSYFSSSTRRASSTFRPAKVKVLRWMHKMERYTTCKSQALVQVATQRKRGRLSSMFSRLGTKSSSPVIAEQPALIKPPLALDAFCNVQVLLLSGSVMQELQGDSQPQAHPLAALLRLRTLIICNYDAKDGGSRPVDGRALNMEDVVYWIKGSHITSLELFDPIIVPGYIPDEITSADFPDTLNALLLLAYTTHDAPSFPKLMQCLPHLRSLTIVPAINTKHHEYISPAIFPAHLENLTIVGSSLKLHDPFNLATVSRLRQYNNQSACPSDIQVQPALQHFSLLFPDQMWMIQSMCQDGLLPNLTSIELFWPPYEQEYGRIIERNAEEVAQFKAFCENSGLQLEVKNVESWQVPSVPNLLYEYLAVLPRGRSDWG